jgi:hypothetical protein
MSTALNKGQKRVLLLGMALMILSELFPPWRYIDNDTSAERSAGYHFITITPTVKSPEEMRMIFPQSYSLEAISVSKNRLRLHLQRLFIPLLTIGLFAFFKDRLSFSLKISGILIIFIGVGFAIFWVIDVNIRGL